MKLFRVQYTPVFEGASISYHISATFYRMLLEHVPKQALVFKCLQYKSFENTVGKGQIAHSQQFLLFPQYFLPFFESFSHFHQV